MGQPISQYCVYTIQHRDKLKAHAKSFHEAKRWVTAADLLAKAKRSNQNMPVLFADAAKYSPLLFWGILKCIEISDEGTTYFVEQLREITGQHTAQDLVLRSTGKNIKRNYIRPYAICETPEFLDS